MNHTLSLKVPINIINKCRNIIFETIKYLSSNEKAKLISLVVILSAFSFNHAFNFHLYVDDWFQILGALYYPEIIHGAGFLGIHPGSVLEITLFAPFFKFNPHPWQLMGYLIKIAQSLSMWPFMIALSKSKRAAFYACLIFAVFVVGIESIIWVSPQASAFNIVLINLGFYFWVKSEGFKSIKYFLFALILFALSILADPGRGFIILPLVLLWEFLSVYQKFSFRRLAFFSLRAVLLLPLIPITTFIFQNYFGVTSNFSQYIKNILLFNFVNLINVLQYPLFGWTLLPRNIVFWATAVSLFILPLLIILFLWKKGETYKIVLFLYIWIFLFYLPNFLTQYFARSGVATESRYYAISSVGVVGLLAYGFSFIQSKYINWILGVFLVFNLYVTNNVLKGYSSFRSIQVHNKIWGKIDQDVPKDEKMSVFMYSGENYLRRERFLDWQDTIPFALKRGIIRKEEFPIMTNDKNLIARLICEKNVPRHSPFGNLIQKEPIPLSHVHAWELKNEGGELENRSEQERDGIKKIAACLQSNRF